MGLALPSSIIDFKWTRSLSLHVKFVRIALLSPLRRASWRYCPTERYKIRSIWPKSSNCSLRVKCHVSGNRSTVISAIEMAFICLFRPIGSATMLAAQATCRLRLFVLIAAVFGCVSYFSTLLSCSHKFPSAVNEQKDSHFSPCRRHEDMPFSRGGWCNKAHLY